MKLLALLAALPFTLLGQIESQLPIPPSAWQQLPQGIALAISLTTTVQSGNTENRIVIDVQNKSDTDKILIDGKIDHGIRIYYLDGQGHEIPLHKYPGAKLEEPNQTTKTLNRKSVLLRPTQTTFVSFHVSDKEFVVIRSHRFKCVLVVYDPATKQDYTLQTKP